MKKQILRRFIVAVLTALCCVFAFAACDFGGDDGGDPIIPKPPAGTFEVAFDSRGGSDVAKLANVAGGSKITKPTDPTRADYIFDGWFKEVGYINAWDFSADTVTRDITLYAKWAPDENGGGTHTHTWSAWTATTPATCTTAGVETRTCTTNPTHTETRPVDALGHDWGAWTATTPVTETTPGAETRVCKHDSSHTETRVSTPGLAYRLINDDAAYEVSGAGTALQLGYTEIVIPSQYQGLPVTSIGDQAFRRQYSITSVIISDSVTNIGRYAFSDCTGLTSLTIPFNVTSINNYAFENTNLSITWYYNPVLASTGRISMSSSLTTVIILNSVTRIESYAFADCIGLTSVIIPDGVTRIDSYAFAGCTGLTSVIIPFSVTNTGDDVFRNCVNLSVTWYYNPVIPAPSSRSIRLYLTTVIIPDGVKSISGWAFNGAANLTDVTIPGSVTRIYNEAFQNCTGLTSITIPNSVTLIGFYAFSGCTGLTSITIPSGVTSIEHYAFAGWTNAQTINIESRSSAPSGWYSNWNSDCDANIVWLG